MANNNIYETSLFDTIKEFSGLIAKLVSGFVVLIVIFLGVGLYQSSVNGSSSIGVNDTTWVPDYSFKTGKAGSKVQFVYFVDFQCSACKGNDPALISVMDKYKDRVEFVVRNFPLTDKHPYAKVAAEASMAVNKLNPEKFLDFKKSILAQQEAMTPALITQIAKQNVTNPAEYDKVSGSIEIEKQVKRDLAFISSRNLKPSAFQDPSTKPTGTPTNVILKDGQVDSWWIGGQSLEEQSKQIDLALAK